MSTFQFKQFTFVVKRSNSDPSKIVYRDAEHIGGPWSSAKASVECKSLDANFRRRLRQTALAVAGTF